MPTIFFKNGASSALVGNRDVKIVGLSISHPLPGTKGHIMLHPINSGNLRKIGRCSISIPYEDVREVAKELQGDLLGLVLDNISRDQLPLLLGLNQRLDREVNERLSKKPEK